MVNLNSIRGKVTPAIGGMIILYLVILTIFAFKLWPTRGDALRLEIKLSDQKRHETNLLRIIEQEPALEKQKEKLQERLLAIQKQIPTQYDLSQVLEFLEHLGKSYGMEIQSLEHVPLRADREKFFGTVPLRLEMEGNNTAFSYLLQIQDAFPSLHISEAVVEYAGLGRFQFRVAADLQVLMAENAFSSVWQRPSLEGEKFISVKTNAFGLPFATVHRFLTGEAQVLGIVETAGQFDALVMTNGEKRWVKVGDFLGDAVITSISGEGVWLDVDGVDLRLTIGG